MLTKFFAVTATDKARSLYVVGSNIGGAPSAVKEALQGKSNFNVGEQLGDGSSMLAISKDLQFYIPEGGGITSFQRKLEEVNTRWWGSHSAPIIALFLTSEAAWKCFETPNVKTPDDRWFGATIEVMVAIGREHPVFEVCTWPELCLLEPGFVEAALGPELEKVKTPSIFSEDDDLPF